ncbi:MAG: DNA repair protein RecN [Cocleimonas sp.]|nr:DNA repair protein RecN [Cocleimonas sp.]
MLTHIYIRDFAIIETLDLDLQTGMTALTGETGAGKSILVDAIGLVLGDRADSGVVRHGAKSAEITLSIDISKISTAKRWLATQLLDWEEDACILRRVISATGKSRAWINGSPSNLKLLRQLGEQLVEIHGQHEHQSLMKKYKQQQLLDEFSGNEDLLLGLAPFYRQWKTTHDLLERLIHQDNNQKAKLALLQFQIEELDALQLAENEVDTLNKEHVKLSNIGQLLTASSDSVQRLYDDDEQSLYSQLSTVLQGIEQQITLDERFKVPYELLLSAQIQLQEASDALRQYKEGLALDPERLDWVENRISDIYHLARKHHVNVEHLYEKWQRLKADLASLLDNDYDLEVLEQQREQMKYDYVQQAKKLSQRRKQAADKLGVLVSQAMQRLGMQGGVFHIGVTFLAQRSPTLEGMDSIMFEVSANPGQPLKPLVKVASGGELSRISLAIQMIAAQRVTLPVLIFDEVDAGIGGGTAEVVGQQLRGIGDSLQVLCVTHLPQVASQAHHHYKVIKIKEKLNTSTGIVQLNQQARVEEIARMMGGIEITNSTLDVAVEMLTR